MVKYSNLSSENARSSFIRTVILVSTGVGPQVLNKMFKSQHRLKLNQFEPHVPPVKSHRKSNSDAIFFKHM